MKAKIMLVLFVDTVNQHPDETHKQLMESGFSINRIMTAAYPIDQNDQPDDTGMYIMQEVVSGEHS